MIRFLSLIFLLSFLCQVIDSSPINLSIDAVTLLLPVSINQNGRQYSVKYPIHAFGSCFQFQSINQSIAQVEPIESSRCSVDGMTGHTGAYVTSSIDIERFQGRVSTRVIVQSINQSINQTERVEVWVDAIHSISPKTTSRNLKVRHYETIEVFAYDDQSNIFSSIEGLPFTWSIQSIDQSTNQPISQSVFNRRSLSETRLNVSQSILDLESINQSSSLIVGVGETSGIARVKALFEYPSINKSINRPVKQSISTEFDVIIVEEIELSPVISIIAPGSDLSINAIVTADESINQSIKPQMLSFPHAQYRFAAASTDQSVNQSITMNEMTGQLTGRSIGELIVTLIDRLIDSHREQAQVTVSKPQSISLSIKQDDQSFEPCQGQFSLKPGQTYQLIIRLLDSSNRLMTLTPNLKFNLNIGGSNIQILDDQSINQSNNQISVKQSQHSITVPFTVIKQGPSSITLSLTQIQSALIDFVYTLDQPINQSIRLIGTPPMSIFPVTARIPYVDKQTINRMITVTGGSGYYEWSVSEPKVAKLGKSINQSSITVTPLTRGLVDVIVRDKCSVNQSIKSHLTFVPAQIQLIPGMTEVQALDTVTLRIKIVDLGVKSPKVNQSVIDPDSSWTPNQAFSDCSDIKVNAQIVGPKFLVILSKTEFYCQSCYCPVIIIQSNNQKATSSVKVSLSEAQSLTVPIGISKPITCQETEYEAAVGSPIIVRVDNGPLDRGNRVVTIRGYSSISKPVPLTNQSIFTANEESALIVGKQEKLDVVPIPDRPNHFLVTCHKVSYTSPIKMVIEAYNRQSVNLSIPLHARSLINLYCYPRVSLSGPISVGVGGNVQVMALIDGTSKPHPLAHDLLYSVDDLSIASISETGLIAGQSIGQTIVTAELPRLYSVDSATDGLVARTKVSVEFGLFQIISSIDCLIDCLIVENQSINLHIESDRRAHPGQSAFNSVQCIWSINQSINQSINGLMLTPLLSDQSINQSINQLSNQVIGTSVQLTGLSVGHHTIFASIHVGEHSYSINQSIIVLPELRLINQSINRSKLLLPFGSSVKLMTNHDQSINQLNGEFDVSAVSFNAPGLLTINQSINQSVNQRIIHVRQSSQSINHGEDSIILIQSQYRSIDQSINQSNNQSIAVHVSVRPVAALLVRVDQSINQSINQPLSLDQSIIVSMIITDSLGRLFDYSLIDHQSVNQSINQLTVSVNDTSMLLIEHIDAQSMSQPINQTSVIGYFRISVHPSMKKSINQSISQSYQSAVITVKLKDYPHVKPIYIETYIQSINQSNQSINQLISMKLKLSNQTINRLIDHVDQREKLIDQLTNHFGRVIGVDENQSINQSINQLSVRSVDLVNGLIEFELYPSINQSIRRDQWFLIDQFSSLNQSINQLTVQSINQSITSICDRAFDELIDLTQSVEYQSIDCLTDCVNVTPMAMKWIEPINQSTDQSTNQSTDQSINQLNDQSINEKNEWNSLAQKMIRENPMTWSDWLINHRHSFPMILSLIGCLIGGLYLYHRIAIQSLRQGLQPSFRYWLIDGSKRFVYACMGQSINQSINPVAQDSVGRAINGRVHNVRRGQ